MCDVCDVGGVRRVCAVIHHGHACSARMHVYRGGGGVEGREGQGAKLRKVGRTACAVAGCIPSQTLLQA